MRRQRRGGDLGPYQHTAGEESPKVRAGTSKRCHLDGGPSRHDDRGGDGGRGLAAHKFRGAMAGALKKKLGLNGPGEDREEGRVFRIA